MRKRLFAFVSIILSVVLLNTAVISASEAVPEDNVSTEQSLSGDQRDPAHTQTEYKDDRNEPLLKEGTIQKPAEETDMSEAQADSLPLKDEDGVILVYDYDQLMMTGSGMIFSDDNGSTEYTLEATYRIVNDIELPGYTPWNLPEGFTGAIIPTETGDKPLYDEKTDTIYLYNPYQLAVMAMEDAYEQPVLSGDANAESFGTGQPVTYGEGNGELITYGPGHRYVISAAFDSNVSAPPVSVRKMNMKASPLRSVEPQLEGRDFAGQVIKKIGGVTYILIGNEEQLRAIGTDAEVYSPVYQLDYTLLHGFVLDKDANGDPIQLYGGDADLSASQNGYGDFGFRQINDKTQGTRYYAGVDQETGEPYLDAIHSTLNKDNTLGSSWRTGEKYSTSSNYIIFRDIDLGGQSAPWTPLMFNGTMYGAKTASGEKLWDGSSITDSTVITATDVTNRPVISNVYVNKDTVLNVNEFTGVGFFATVSNRINTSNFGLSGGTAIVKNLELNNVHVENNTSSSGINQTLVNVVTESLGGITGILVELLVRLLSFGSASTDLRSTLSNLLNARAKDPTVFATGSFAGRVYGDTVIEDCCVSGTVEVSNINDRTGGFVGYTEGLTEYSNLSNALGIVSTVLADILNLIPAVGLGDLITILLENALPVGSLIPTGYKSPLLKNCEVNGLTGNLGADNTNMAGGFAGQQIGTRIENCRVTDSDYIVNAIEYGGGFTGLERDAEIKGTLDGVGIDLSSIIRNVHPQSVLVDCEISNSSYQVVGDSCLGGFVGAMTSSYAVDCTVNSPGQPIYINGTGDYAGGFAGYATVGWQSNLGKDENIENSLLGTVRQLVISLLSTDKAAGQSLLTLMGVSPSAILGCQINSGELVIEAGGSFAGGITGKGEGIYISSSDQETYDDIAAWNTGTLKEIPYDRPVILNGLKSVTAHEDYAGGIAGYLGSAAFQGLLNDVVGLGDFIGFNVKDITVTGADGGYTVAADNCNAGGGFGLAVGGTITNVKLNELQNVQAFNRAAGFVGIAGPGELAGTNGLTVNLLGLDRVLEVSNLLNIGQSLEVQISDCDVTGIDSGYTVEATGRNTGSEVNEYTAAGFIADSNSTKINDSHCHRLLSVTAADDHGFAGGFIGTSETGGLAEVANNDATSVKSLIEANGLVKAIAYLIPEYINCTADFVDGGFVDGDTAGGFVADLSSGTVDNSTISTVDDAQDPKWTRIIKELYDPDAVNATGDLQKQFAVINIDKVKGRTYAGGFGGKLRSGALASAGGGLSILGDSGLGLNIDITDLLSVMNAYVPFVKNAGVYSENGFTVEAFTLRDDDPDSGSAGGFGGYISGAQISHSDVYRLKHTEVTPPDDLEASDAPSYFDGTQSAYAVKGGHYAGGYVGKMDIGSAASLGKGLKVLGNNIQLTNILSALSVVVSTIEHSDVEGAAGGFSVLADADASSGKVGMSGGFAGGIYGGHIQNSHCRNFYYVIGQEAAGGYVGNMEPGDVAKLLDSGSILGSLINVDTALASLVEDFVPTIRNSTTSCVPCGGAVRAHSPSDGVVQRGSAGGYCGYNEGGHIWGLNTNTWKDQNDGIVGNTDFGINTVGSYTGEQHICTAWRIRSVYGHEYAGGFTGYMESADTAGTGSIGLLGGIISVNNVLNALSAVYPTEENTAVYGPLRNMDELTWSAWAEYVGKYGGYGAELARLPLSEIDKEHYYYGCNVAAGRSLHDNMIITEGGNAGGYVGYMVTGVITNGQSHDMKLIRAMRSAGGYAGRMQTGSAAEFGTVSILGLNLNLGQLVDAAEIFVPTIKSGSVYGYQSGMTVEGFGRDEANRCGYAGGYVGSAYGAQIWGDKNVGDTPGTGCNVINLRFVRGRNAAGGYAGLSTAASVADVNTNASKGFLQNLLNTIVSNPKDLVSVLQATVSTIRQAEVNPDDPGYGFVIEGLSGVPPKYAGGFAGSLEATVVGSLRGESRITVNGLNSVDGLYYAGGFFGLADVGSVANVGGTAGDGSSVSILDLIYAGSVDVLDIFRTYIYYSDVNGIDEGFVVRAHASAPEGMLSEVRYSGCGGGFGGGMMNGTVKNSNVTKLNTVTGPNYNGGFIGHMGKNGLADVDRAVVSQLVGLNTGVLDIIGTVVDNCNVTGVDHSDGTVINKGAVIFSSAGEEPIAGGFAGYADVSQINNSSITGLKLVRSDETAGGFAGKTNMNYLVEAEVDSALVQIVLGILNTLLKILQVNSLEDLDLINTDSWLDYDSITRLLGLKLLSDGELLYVNLLGLRVGISLVHPDPDNDSTGTVLITIGDSSVELPYNENGIDINGENAELVINLIKGNRTRVDKGYVKGVDAGYDVYGGGATNEADGSTQKGYAGGFVGYNNEGRFTSNLMEYCDVVRGSPEKTGPFSGTTSLESVYSFNTLSSIEMVSGEENHYSVYRVTDLEYALDAADRQIGSQAVTDTGTPIEYKRFDITHLAQPITPGDNEAYYKIFEKWKDAVLAANVSGADKATIEVYESSGKAVLMKDIPSMGNDESLVPVPGETMDPCDETMNLTIQKIWDDWNDFGGVRPDSIRVRIIQHWKNEDGSDVEDQGNPKITEYKDGSLIPDMDENGWFEINVNDHGRTGSSAWTRVVEGLPVYTTEGSDMIYFEYTVEEFAVDGYDTSVSHDTTGSTATATIRNKRRSILPFTGGGTDILFILLGIGLVILAVFLIKRRKVFRPPRDSTGTGRTP